MAHVVVGERLAGAAPEIAGHVMRGAGHFVEMAGGLFQPGAMNMPAIPVIAGRSINDLSTPMAAEQWQWERMGNQYGSGSLIASSSHESMAQERHLRESIEKSLQNTLEVAQDTAISWGSFMAGDFENGVQYGASAAEKYVNGLLKDLGFNGGWGEKPMQGTLQPTGAGRD